MAEPVGAVDKAGIRIWTQRPPTAPSVPAARTLETFATLATVERDGRRVSPWSRGLSRPEPGWIPRFQHRLVSPRATRAFQFAL